MANSSNRFRRQHPRTPTLVERAVDVAGHLVVTALVVGGLWTAGLVWFVLAVMPDPASPPTDRRTDAVVVLTGGSERLRTGLRLLESDAGQALFVSGVHPGTTLDALLAEAAAPDLPDTLRRRMELGHVATDTVGNAIETAVWVRETGQTSVRLVTAGYHMPRSLLEFRAALPGVDIVPHPVFPDIVKQEDWWRYPGTTALFASEFSKYLVARLRLHMPDRPHRTVFPPSHSRTLAPDQGTSAS